MKVLLAANLNSGNTYIDSLYSALAEQQMEVTASEDDFWDANKNFDVVHVHWLEGLFNWNIKNITLNDLNRFKFRLEQFKQTNTKIIITRHNRLPHNINDNPLIIQAYNLFYTSISGVIHLGQFSQTDFQKEQPHLSTIILHTVIPHGNYLNLKNSITKATARKLLKIDKNRFVFICFGRFRKEEERNLVMQAFKEVNIPNKTLLCSAWDLPHAKDSFNSKLKRKSYNLSKAYTLFNTFVSDENVQTYMNAADVLIVPRLKQLNSGLVYLGLSFGKIIVAPAIGNITEAIKETNNFLYNPKDIDSLTEAMVKAYKVKDSNLDYDNRVYAKDHGDWSTIANQHIEFYKKMLDKNLDRER